MNLDKKKKFIINALYFALWFIIIFFVFKVAVVYLFPFFIGVIIAYVVQKPSQILSTKIKLKKELCSAVLSVVFFVVISVLLILSAWFFYMQIADIFKSFSDNSNYFELTNFINNVNKIFKTEKIFANDAVRKFLENMLNLIISKVGNFISTVITNIIKNLPYFFISSVITIVATCYISKDFDRLKSFFKGIFGQKIFENAVEIKNILTDCVFKIFIGYFWIFLITLLELMIGFLILKINNFFIIAVLVALFDLLPIIGTGTVLLPWSLILFIQNDYTKGVCMVLLYFTTVVVRNFIEPKIIGKQIEINPLFMLVFIFLGLRICGAIGMIIFPIVFTVSFTYYRRKNSQ